MDIPELFLKYNNILIDYKITCPADIDNLQIDNDYLPFDKNDIDEIVSRFVPIELDREIPLITGRDNTVSAIFANA